MAILSRADLKTFFETTDEPTEGQFADLIDSLVNIVDDLASAPADVKLAKVPISSAEILALFSTPKVIVSAPGANKAIFVLNAGHKYIFNTTAYLTDFSTNLRYAVSGKIPWRVSHGIDGVITRRIQYNRQLADSATANIISENEDLTLRTDSLNPTTGDGTLIVYAVYTILDLS